ncbi:phage tail tape measure protein [Gilliamella sp. Nev6-6]|uniref:phage tail tape measure protein n=1 Tax=Gilliamella sp. Nev6-6 TaxID=3120252 RepID=UPI00080F3DEA|nr:phage tail tape measure protein [Gilliamella apicola]OCG78817.1 phage tail tape measure protein [Gilliamella apicola]
MNDLQLKITLNGIDKTSRPLRNVMGGAKELAQQLKDTRNQLNKLNNTQKNVDGFVQLRKQFEEAKNKAKSLAIELKNTTTPTKALQREFNKATAETKKLKDKLTPLRAELHQSGISTKNLTQHQITLKNQITSVNQSIGQQSERLKQLNIRQQKISQIRSKYDIGMQRMAVLGGVGYGALSTGKTVARGMKNLLHVGYEFDASMSATQAVTRIDDKNDPRMLALRKQARELPLVSKFTDSEVAQGQYFLGRTGYNPDQILKAMPHVLNLAAAGDLDLATTADISSNIQKAMRIPAEEMGKVSDALTAAFTRNNVDIRMLGESLKYTAGISQQYGQSLETLTTATALLGNAGIQGSQAGTSLRQVLIRIGNSNTVKKLEIKTADKNGNMRDLGDIFEEIQKATSHMGNVQRAAIYKDIAGQIGVTGFNELMATVETGEFQAMRRELYNSKGEAAKVAKIKLDNLAGDMTMLHAAFENISVELFEKNNDWLRKAVQGLTNLLHGFGEFLKKHPAVSKALVVIGAGLATITTAFGAFAIMIMSIFGPMLMTRFILSRLGLSLGGLFTKTNIAGGGLKTLGRALLSIAGSPIKTLGAALKSLGFIFTSVGRAFLFTPIGLAITAIIAVIVIAALVIRKYWEPIKAWFIGFWEGLKESLSPVAEEFSYLEPFVTTIGDGFKWLGEKISSLINWFCELFEPVKLTKEEFKNAKESGKSFGRSVGEAIRWPLSMLNKLYLKIKDIIDFIQLIPTKINDMSQKIEAAFTGENSIFNKLSRIGSDISNGVITGINNKWDETKKAVSNLGTNIGNWFKNTLDIHSPSRVFSKFGGYTIDGYIHGIEHNQSEALRSMNQLGKKISNRFKNTLDIHSPSRLFAKFGSHTVDGYINGIEGNQDDAIHKIKRFANDIITTGSQLSNGVVVDNRRPISGASGVSQYYITINAAPGMNEQELARCVAKEIERRERNQSARYRSSLRDID